MVIQLLKILKDVEDFHDKMKALGTTASELDPQGVTQTERELDGIVSG